MPARLASVLRVIYLVFNEGYSASSGEVADARRAVGRGDPARAPRGRAPARARGDRAARADAAAGIAARGAPVRRRRPRPARRAGPHALGPRADRRGTARSCSARSPAAAPGRTRSRPRSRPCTPTRADPAATDWAEIVGLYDVLLRLEPSPVVELNRAVAVAMRDGPAAGLALIDRLLARRRARRLPPRARRARRPRAAARPGGGGARVVRARDRAGPPGARSGASSSAGSPRCRPDREKKLAATCRFVDVPFDQ